MTPNDRFTHRLRRRAGGSFLPLYLAMLGLFSVYEMLAWRDNNELLAAHRADLGRLAVEHAQLANHVALLDPKHPDLDYLGELLRARLNVMHPNEVMSMTRPENPEPAAATP